MSPESQRVALAELCGWTKSPLQTEWQSVPYGTPPGGDHRRDWKRVPDYLNDLNAIDDATWRLSPTQFSRFLTELTAFPNLGRCADARERAKCILRACGKWVEAK